MKVLYLEKGEGQEGKLPYFECQGYLLVYETCARLKESSTMGLWDVYRKN